MAYALVTQNDPRDLTEFLPDEDLAAALTQDGKEGLDPVAVPHVFRELVGTFQAMQLLDSLTGDVQKTRPANWGSIEIARRKLQAKALEGARRFGKGLAETYRASRAFCTEPTFQSADKPGTPTLANYDRATSELQSIRHISSNIHDQVCRAADGLDSLRSTAAAVHAEDALVEAYGIEDIATRLHRVRDVFYTDTDVRLLLKTRGHADSSRRVKDGAYVLETPTVTELLNKMHRQVYGRKSRDVMGVALGGPPGWGKTAIVTHYIKETVGVDPVSIDIDPGQSAFTLMAKPRLIEADPVSATLKTIEQIDGMSLDMLQGIVQAGGDDLRSHLDITDQDLRGKPNKGALAKKLKAGLVTIAHEQMAGLLATTERRGPYVYGPIYEALERNVPVIINEVQGLRQQEFLHSLLTAVPATDDEAGPMPNHTPTEGEESLQPKGWFFSTLTGRWMRVPHRFRIFFTGNIGSEFGNQGLPPAIVNRLGDRLQEMPQLPAAEQVDIAWAWVSDRGGKCSLSTEDVAKLYHLITEVVPEIERLYRQKNVRAQKAYFSIRTIIDISRALAPNGSPRALRQKISLEQAIFDQFIQPAIANRYIGALEIVLGVLFAAGYISDAVMKRVNEILPEVKTDQIMAIHRELAAGEAGAKAEKRPVKFDLSEQIRNTYERACVVCGIMNCPAHSMAVKEHIEDIAFQANLVKVQLDPRAVEQAVARQRELADKEQWDHLLHMQIEGAPDGARLTDVLEPKHIAGLSAYIENHISTKLFTDETDVSPHRALQDLYFIEQAQKLGFALDVLARLKKRIETSLHDLVTAQFAPYATEDATEVPDDGDEDAAPKRATIPSTDQLMALRVVDMARRLGYEVDLSSFEQLGSGIRYSLGNKRQVVRSSRALTATLEYLNFLGVVSRLFAADPAMKDYIRERHLASEMEQDIFAVFSLSSGESTLRTDSDRSDGLQLHAPSQARRRAAGRRGLLQLDVPVPADQHDLAMDIDFRSRVLDGLAQWREVIEQHTTDTEALGAAASTILQAQGQWLEKNKGGIIEHELTGPYLGFVFKLAKMQGVELSSMIQRIVRPKIMTAPPLREF